jgi:hypothetical protein
MHGGGKDDLVSVLVCHCCSASATQAFHPIRSSNARRGFKLKLKQDDAKCWYFGDKTTTPFLQTADKRSIMVSLLPALVLTNSQQYVFMSKLKLLDF